MLPSHSRTDTAQVALVRFQTSSYNTISILGPRIYTQWAKAYVLYSKDWNCPSDCSLELSGSRETRSDTVHQRLDTFLVMYEILGCFAVHDPALNRTVVPEFQCPLSLPVCHAHDRDAVSAAEEASQYFRPCALAKETRKARMAALRAVGDFLKHIKGSSSVDRYASRCECNKSSAVVLPVLTYLVAVRAFR